MNHTNAKDKFKAIRKRNLLLESHVFDFGPHGTLSYMAPFLLHIEPVNVIDNPELAGKCAVNVYFDDKRARFEDDLGGPLWNDNCVFHAFEKEKKYVYLTGAFTERLYKKRPEDAFLCHIQLPIQTGKSIIYLTRRFVLLAQVGIRGYI